MSDIDWSFDRAAGLAALRTVISERFGPVTDIEPLPTWGPTVVALVRFVSGSAVVAKCSARQDVAAEVAACRLAAGVGLPVPRVVATGETERLPGRYWFAMSFLTGVPWADLPVNRDEHVVRQLADHFVRLHSIQLSGFGSLTVRGVGADSSWPGWIAAGFDRELGALADSGQRVSDLVTASQSAVARLEPVLASRPGRLVHADLGDREVLVDVDDAQVTGLVDWGSAIVGDPLFEFAKFVGGGPVDDPRPGRLLPLLRRHYGARTGVDWSRTRPLMALYEAHNAVTNANWARREGTGWAVSLLDRARELLAEVGR